MQKLSLVQWWRIPGIRVYCKLSFNIYQVVKQFLRGMAWRSIGKDNNDLVAQLAGIYYPYYLSHHPIIHGN